MPLRNFVSGQYETSFFIIYIDSDASIESIAADNIGTFTHEYIHFLQDLSLPYCMRENLATLNEFFAQVDKAVADGNVHLPSTIDDEDCAITAQQSRLTWGDSAPQADANVILSVNQQVHGPYQGPKGAFRVFKYIITTNKGSYHLGARDLLEYIAHAIEQKHHPSEDIVPALPYQSVDLVFEYQELSEATSFQRIAIAEYCLLNDNPVHRLFVVTDKLKTAQGRLLLQKSELEFAAMLLATNWSAEGQPEETINGKLGRRFRQLRALLLTKFPQTSFPAVYSWINLIMQYVPAQVAGQLLFARLYAISTEEFDIRMKAYMTVIGVPLIMNRKRELGTSLGNEIDKDQFIQLLLAFEFHNYLKHDSIVCPIAEHCERDRPDIINDDCLEGPFRRVEDKQLCPFATFLKAHGIDNLSWYVEKRLVPRRSSGPYS